MSQSISQQSTQAIIGIVFGIVMCVLAVITLLQGYRHKCRSAAAISTAGQPSAVTSDVNIATVEDGTYHRPIQGHQVVLPLINFFHISNNAANPLPTIESRSSTPFPQPQSSPGFSNTASQTQCVYSIIGPTFISNPNSDAGDMGCQNTMSLA